MPKADAIAEIAADGVADGMHIVSEEALAVEKVVRGLEGMQIAYIGMGVALGAVLGGFAGFVVAFRKAEAKYNEIAADEISMMRHHFDEKQVALEQVTTKGELADIIKERRYSGMSEKSARPPMAVSAPESVVEAAEATRDAENDLEVALQEHAAEREDETRQQPEEVRNVFREAEGPIDTWDHAEERRHRSPLRPYIVHIDERADQQSYDSVTFTYFEADDVLCNERDEVIAGDERDRLIGESHLEKFGHGSGDASIVYIRNDKLEIDFEIVRSPNSYAEEVHGFQPDTEPEIRHSHRRGRDGPLDDE